MEYYLYFRKSRAGPIIRREELASCDSDETALGWMKSRAGQATVELWQRARLVATHVAENEVAD